MAQQWPLCPRELASGVPLEFPLVLPENPRKGPGGLHVPGLLTPVTVRGRWQGSRVSEDGSSRWHRAPARPQSSVVWPGLLGDPQLGAVLWRAAGRHGQALHGLPLVLLSLVVEQDAGRHQDGAHG